MILRPISLILIFLLFSLNAESAGRWNFDVPEPTEPICLNCCDISAFNDECNAKAQGDFRRSFLKFRSVASLPSGLIAVGSLPFAFSYLSASNGMVHPVAAIVSAFIANLAWSGNRQLIKSLYRWWLAPSLEYPERVILALYAKDDWNGALSTPFFADLEGRYLVLFHKISDVSEIEHAIVSVQKRFKQPIKAVLIGAHGGFFDGKAGKEGGFVLNSHEHVTRDSLYVLRDVFSLLPHDAKVIMESCNSATIEGKSESTANLPQTIAEVAGGREVWGAASYVHAFTELNPDNLRPRFHTMLMMFLWIPSLYTELEYALGVSICYVANQEGKVVACHEAGQKE